MPHFPLVAGQHTAKYNLENITKLLAFLDNPHLKLPPVIHVAGTNGKGSSVAMFTSIFKAAGYQVHAYTSPHLLEVNERIVLQGEKISDFYLFEICEKTRIASLQAGVEPSFFEGLTAAAFLAFASVNADILIIETGLGGRLDATNVIEKPLITLITSISYDHMHLLGDTLPLIASEKAGIIKPFVPCVISAQVWEVYEILLAKCQDLNSSAFCYEYDFGLKKNLNSFNYLSNQGNYQFPFPSLPGDHQLINAASVIAAITLINDKFNITNNNIEKGLQNIHWPARIQKIAPHKYRHLAGAHVQIWVDGAHNSGGAMALAAWIADNLTGPIYLILGMTKNRDVADFCGHLKLLTVQGYGVRVLSEVMSYNSQILCQKANAAGMQLAPQDSLEQAIREISNLKAQGTNIIITGSLFLAADFLKLIE